MTAAAPMRIAFVADAVFPYNKGGKETRLYEITRHLARDGHRVDIYTMKWWEGPRTVEHDGVRFHAICPYLPLYTGRRRSTVQALAFGLATLGLLTRRFDALDVDHMPVFPLFSAKLVALLRRKPLCGTWHEVWGPAYWRSYLGVAGLIGYLTERLSFHMPGVIIANSEQTAERLLDIPVRPKVQTVPLGVDFVAIDTVDAAERGSDVIFAGRLLEHKNVHLLVDALALLQERRPLRAVIVGEGPERARLEARATELGVADAIRFLDFLPEHRDVFALMKASRVFVLPSTREGFGAVVLEANACGIPVITVDHPDNAARSLIAEGENGFVCPPTARALADALVRCLDARPQLAAREAIERRGLAADWSAVAGRIGAIVRAEIGRPVAEPA